MSNIHPDRPGDQIRRTLADTADEIIVEPTDASALLSKATSRRRRRHGVIAGTSIAALAAVGGIVVSTRDSGGDSIQSAEDVATETETAEDVAAGGGDDRASDAANGDATTPAAPPVTPPPTLPPLADSSLTVADYSGIASPAAAFPAAYGPSQVFAWGDGFLTVEVDYQPQPLPELPDEIIDLFPPEIIEIFEPEGLPPTIDEAIARLSDAGYLDEVTTILGEHPEASAAIYAEPSAPITTARFSRDGVAWEDIDLDVPLTEFGQFGVSGDRLFAWSTPYDPGSGSTDSLEIATTTDLANWTLSVVDLPDLATITPTADYQVVDTFVNGLAIVGDRWMAMLQQHTWVDYERLIPAELLSELQERSAEFGYGYYPSADGLVVEVCDQLGCNEDRVLSWAELGLDGPPESFDDGPPQAPSLITGSLVGDARQLPVPEGIEWGEIRAVGKRFVMFGARTPLVSFDGIDWSPLLADDVLQWANSVTEVDGGLLVVGESSEGRGSAAVIVADDGTVIDVALPELPQRYGLWNQDGSSAWIVELFDGDDVPDEPFIMEPITVTVAAEGYDVEITTDFAVNTPTIRYRVLDPASGDELLAGAVDAETVESDHVVTDPDTGEGFFVIVDPATGDEFVRVRELDIEQAFSDVFENELPEITEEPAVYEERWQPDLWLVATRNGIDWLTLDLPNPDVNSEYGYYPNTAAVNGNTVLYRTNDGGWATAQLP